MRCLKCSIENREGRKFCAECGAALKARCVSCNAENELGEKFCGECGKPLASLAQADPTESPSAKVSPAEIRVTSLQSDSSTTIDGERKTVTALFADIKGSTELMADLDPEEARAIIDPALKLMIEAVQRYDGYVVQSTGDGIFALFGAPVAHEDHPQRTLYAALRLQEELKRYSAKVVAEGSSPIQGRVGINTGEVVVRSIHTGAGQTEYTPIGHTTNLASRMQTAAPVGSIAVSDTTQKLCEGYFVLKPLGATKVKGVGEPVSMYEVTGLGPLRTRLQRAAGRGLTKFVGRDREMDVLKHAAEQAKSGHGQIVAAMADAGIGKSRLFYEFKATCQSGWMVLETLSVSHGKASAYLPVIELLRNYFRLANEDDERIRREKVAGRLSMLDPSLENTRAYLFSLLCIFEGNDPLAQMDAQVRKRRTLDAIKRILLRESVNQPLMVIFEDLHWIDNETQEFLDLLASSIGNANILLLVNYRPEYSHQWNSKNYCNQLRLEPLGKESAEEMLSALLGDGKDLIPLRRLIMNRTEGTPFFMEEIVQALFEDGVLRRNGTVKLAKSMNAVKVPSTVQAVLASRIDRLPAKEKELLQTLSVLGRQFSLGLVRSVTEKQDAELESRLSGLQAGEFIYEQPATTDVEYVFKHALTQEVAYSALLIEQRKILHERAASALESMFAEQLDDHLDELAHHYRRTDSIAKAVEYLGKAGQRALHRSGHIDAVNNFSSALDLVRKLPKNAQRAQHELPLQLTLGNALIAVKGWAAPEVEDAFNRARQLSDDGRDSVELFPALYGLWLVYLLRGQVRRAYEFAEQLLPMAQKASDSALVLQVWHALGSSSYWLGNFLQAKKYFENVIALYDPEYHGQVMFRYDGVDTKVRSLSYTSFTLWQLGYPDQALNRGREAIAHAQHLSNSFSLAFAHSLFATTLQFRREARAIQELAEREIAFCTENGFAQLLAYATTARGWAMATQERHEEGIIQVQEGLAAIRTAGAELLRPYNLCCLAEALLESGRLDGVSDALNEALFAADTYENRSYEAETYRLKGELLLKQNRSKTEAQHCFWTAIEVARRQSAKSLELRSTMSLARLLASQGRPAEARPILSEIYEWFTEGFDTADLKDAKSLLDDLQRQGSN
jgi:class 3 adenylate cyclase/predicted ATPase